MSGAQGSQVFLTRLERLCRMRVEYVERLNPLGVRLLDRAIVSTAQDCIDFGRGSEAEDLLYRLALAKETKSAFS